LIEEILDFSKIEAGKLDLEARPFTVTTLVEETVELMAPRAQTKGIEIASYVDERLPLQLIGDVARLRQVLLNLVSNAIKFTEKGGVAVIAEQGDDENEVRFEVRDSGIGLKDEDIAHIFLTSSRLTVPPPGNSAAQDWGLRSPSAALSAWRDVLR